MKNQKTMFRNLIVVLALGLFLSSCSQNPAALDLIPKESPFVSVLDVKSLALKAELNAGDFKSLQFLEDEVSNESKELGELYKKYRSNPGETGINVLSDFFLFSTRDAGEGRYIALSTDLSDGKKFEDFVSQMLAESQKELNLPSQFQIEEAGTFKTVVFDDAILAWDNSKMLFMAGQNYEDGKALLAQTESLFALNGKATIKDVASFNRFYERSTDLNLWLSFAYFKDIVPAYQELSNMPYSLDDNYLSLHMDFTNEGIKLESIYDYSDELAKLQKEYGLYDQSFNEKLLNYLPKESYMNASIAINPEGMYKFMSAGGDGPETDMMLSQIQQATGMSMDKILSSFGGSGAFSIYNFEAHTDTVSTYKQDYNPKKFAYYDNSIGDSVYEGGFDFVPTEEVKENTIPRLATVFDLKDQSTFQKLLENEKVKNNILKTEKGSYVMDLGQTVFFFEFKDDMAFFCNDPELVKAFQKDGLGENSLSNNPMAANMKNSHFTMYLNLNKADYPEIVQSLIGDGLMRAPETAMNWISSLRSLDVSSEGTNKASIQLKTEKTDHNSLHEILKISEDFIF